MTEEEQPISLDTMEIMKMLPHRYPFLLVDRVTECIPGKCVKGYKNVSMNEEFFQGHFPGNPIMPGVLQVEAMAQLSIFILKTKPEYKDKLGLFASMDGVKFKRMVRPGDKLEMESELLKIRGPIAKCKARGFVDGKLAVEAELTVAMQ